MIFVYLVIYTMKFIQKFLDESKYSQRQYLSFGIIFFINYPLYYFVWIYLSPQGYENIYLRIAASLLCVPIIFNKAWPDKIRKYFLMYWYIVTIYCLPFFFTLMTLKNNAAASWIMNLILSYFVVVIIFESSIASLIISIGTIIALMVFFLFMKNSFIFSPGTIDLSATLATFFAAFIIGSIFNRNKELIEKERLQTMKTIAASIAHELRTPLRAIDSGITGIKKCLPTLLESYSVAKEAQLSLPYLNPIDQKALPAVLCNMSTETQAAFNVIDMLLVKSEFSRVNSGGFIPCSMKQCVAEALDRYPFKSNERQLVDWQLGDFTFLGDALLVEHILFNLLKNALYAIKAANKGRMIIWTSQTNAMHCLHFKDTGPGMSKKKVSSIFNRFYSTTPHGTGVGLTFCQMVMKNLNGSIVCQSKKGEFTEFLLFFPKNNK